MHRYLSAFLCGTLFALGLGISQMTRPPKILGFLNVAGDWDPTLLVVMAAATMTYFIGYHFLMDQQIKACYEAKIAKGEVIKARTLIGAAIFGLGWGLIGLCPGPAVTDLISGKLGVIVFVTAMLAGMYPVKYFDSRV